MSKPYTMYYSPFDTYEKCPQRFLWSRGWGNIDVGGGPGRKKPKPVQDSKHHPVMGNTIQKVIEDLYNQSLWKDKVGLRERLLQRTERELEREIQSSYIDWTKAPSKFEMLRICQDGVSGYLGTMVANKLLGPYAKAEAELFGFIDKETSIGGRADVIFRREDTGTTILDGKNSQEKGKYTSPDQLRWYALCHFLMYKKLPDRLGFVYYRYPYGTVNPDGTIESGVDWVSFSRQDVEALAERAVHARANIMKERFDPTPTPSYCKLCEYETVCDARKKQKEVNARGRKKKDAVEGLVEGDFADL